jgi:hypothetical protein
VVVAAHRVDADIADQLGDNGEQQHDRIDLLPELQVREQIPLPARTFLSARRGDFSAGAAGRARVYPAAAPDLASPFVPAAALLDC